MHLRMVFLAIVGMLLGACGGPATAQTVRSSSLFEQIEGFGSATTGGLGGQVYVVTTRADYDPLARETPIIGSLRYGVEQLRGPRWVVFDPALFSEARNGDLTAVIALSRELRLREGDITIDGRAGGSGGRGRRVVLARSYDWADYRPVNDGASCEVRRDRDGRPLDNGGGIVTVLNAQNIILTHLTFRQLQRGAPERPVADVECFGDQIGIANRYEVENGVQRPERLQPTNSFDRIWINHSDFTGCGDECIGVTQPSPALVARLSITGNAFRNVRKAILVGNVGQMLRNRPPRALADQIRLTVAKNVFDTVYSRQPRFNSATVHVYNNFYRNWGYGAVDPTDDSRSLIEQNLFETASRDPALRAASVNRGNHPGEQIWAGRNVYTGEATDRDADIANPPARRIASFATRTASNVLDLAAMPYARAVAQIAASAGWRAEDNDVYR